MICSEIRRYGLSEVIGSWKIIATFVPRTRLSCSGDRLRISCPLRRTLPVARPLAASSPMIDMKIWLLPEPDSPTMPSVSPRSIAKLTWLTALVDPERGHFCEIPIRYATLMGVDIYHKKTAALALRRVANPQVAHQARMRPWHVNDVKKQIVFPEIAPPQVLLDELHGRRRQDGGHIAQEMVLQVSDDRLGKTFVEVGPIGHLHAGHHRLPFGGRPRRFFDDIPAMAATRTGLLVQPRRLGRRQIFDDAKAVKGLGMPSVPCNLKTRTHTPLELEVTSTSRSSVARS